MKSAILATALVLASCASPETEELVCKAGSDRNATTLPLKTGRRYFPESLGQPSYQCGGECQPVISETESTWYPEFWDAATEPSLYLASQRGMGERDLIVRFTWLRTFHHPVFVRITRTAGRTHLIATELSGQGGYEPGKVQKRVERELSTAEAGVLNSILRRSPIFDEPSKVCNLGMDGAQWIFERADQNGYRFINRWSPESGPSRDLGITVLKMTGWTFDEIY
jgi:hypothetical protein